MQHNKDYSTATFTPSDDVLIQKIDGEAVLLNLKNEHYYGLNEIGLRVWELLEEHTTFSPIVETLLEEYDVEQKQLSEDLQQLFKELEENTLISIIETTS